MVFLEIKANIKTSKHLEFSQVKLSFIYDFQTADGFISFIEKPGYGFQIQISWNDQECLSEFMESEKFHFFKGALVALSKNNKIKVLNEEHINKN